MKLPNIEKFIDSQIVRVLEKVQFADWYSTISRNTREVEDESSQSFSSLDIANEIIKKNNGLYHKIDKRENFVEVSITSRGIKSQFNLALSYNNLEIILTNWNNGKLLKSGGPSVMIVQLLEQKKVLSPKIYSEKALTYLVSEITDKLIEINEAIIESTEDLNLT